MQHIQSDCDPSLAWDMIAEVLRSTDCPFVFDLSMLGTP